MTFNLADIIVLVSLTQGFILGFVLLFSRLFKGTHNQFLAYTVLMVSIIGMNEWLSDWDFDEVYYVVDFWGDDVPWVLLVYVPMLWYFLKTTEHPLGNRRFLFVVLAIPFLIFLALNMYINMDVDAGWIEIPNIKRFKRTVYVIEYYFAMGYCLFLNLISFGVIQRDKQSGPQKQWLFRIWGFLTVLIICWMVMALVPREHETANLLFYTLWLGISMFIYWLTYQGLYKFKLAQDQSAIRALLEGRMEASTKQMKSVIEENPVTSTSMNKGASIHSPENSYLQQLDELIQHQKLYKDPQLSRESIAAELGISAGYLSQLLSAQADVNFSSYINRYRIEEVKTLLKDPECDKYSLMAIGREAGFQSKSAFYTTFKKMVGMTPHQFKQSHR